MKKRRPVGVGCQRSLARHHFFSFAYHQERERVVQILPMNDDSAFGRYIPTVTAGAFII